MEESIYNMLVQWRKLCVILIHALLSSCTYTKYQTLTW